MTLTPGTVGQSQLGSYPATPIFNALIPKEGPRMVPFNIDFPTLDEFQIDLTLTVQQKRISVIQSVFIDASNCDATVSLAVYGTLETVKAAPGTQGYYPLLVPDTPKFTASSNSTAPCILIFLNVPVPASVWDGGIISPVLGSVTISDPAAANAPASGDVPLLNSQAGGVAAWTDHSGATAGPAASTQLFPAVAAGSRYAVRVKAPETADMWVNPMAGTAGIDALGCFKIFAGTIYESPPGMTLWQRWNYYCVATGVNFTAMSQNGN